MLLPFKVRMWSDDRPTHTRSECHRLLDRLLMGAGLQHASAHAAGAHGTASDAGRRLGLALWDVFSDNHTVVDARGVCYSLGTFRSSGDEIADALMRHNPDSTYDYLDFYMGSAFGELDLTPEYRYIFAYLHAEGCDWIYSFPRLHLLKFDSSSENAMTEDDPSRAVAEELEQAKKSLDDDMEAWLRRMHGEAVDRARNEPLPATVAAYREVYSRLPEGWPHPDM